MTAENTIRLLRSPERFLPDVLGKMGYGSPGSVDDPIRARVLRRVASACEFLKPDWTVRHAPIRNWTSERIEGEGIMIRSRNWARLLDGMDSPETVCAFAITLGEPLDCEIETRRAGSVFDAWVLDAFGSVAVEQVADSVSGLLARQFAEEGYGCTRRFSPGYCDWDLCAGQAALFDFLDPAAIGIQRFASGAMLPSKSITAVIIAARRIPVKTPCGICVRKKTCDYRREDGGMQRNLKDRCRAFRACTLNTVTSLANAHLRALRVLRGY